MNRPGERPRYREAQFVTTYDPPRLWCQACGKTEALADLTAATLKRLKGEHRCGPRTAPWANRGLAG